MYAPPDFRPPRPASRPHEKQERLIGLAALIVLMILCLALSISLDNDVFIPHNTEFPITLTARASTPGRRPPPTRTPRFADQPARLDVLDSAP